MQLLTAIDGRWQMPYRTDRHLAASVDVRINSAGAVQYAAIGTSSGDQLYDSSVVQAIYRSSPLPLPRDARVFRTRFSVCIGSRLHGCK